MYKKILLIFTSLLVLATSSLFTPIKNTINHHRSETNNKVTLSKVDPEQKQSNIKDPNTQKSLGTILANTSIDLLGEVVRFLPANNTLTTAFPKFFGADGNLVESVLTSFVANQSSENSFLQIIKSSSKKLFPTINTDNYKLEVAANPNNPTQQTLQLLLTGDSVRDFKILFVSFNNYLEANLGTYLKGDSVYADANNGFSQDLIDLMNSFFNILNNTPNMGNRLQTMFNFQTLSPMPTPPPSNVVQGITGKNSAIDNFLFGYIVSIQRAYDISKPGTEKAAKPYWDFSARTLMNYMNDPVYFNTDDKHKDNIYGFNKLFTNLQTDSWVRFVDNDNYFINTINDYRAFLNNIVSKEPTNQSVDQWATLFRTYKDHNPADALSKIGSISSGIVGSGTPNLTNKLWTGNGLNISTNANGKGVTNSALWFVSGKTSTDTKQPSIGSVYYDWIDAAYKYNDGRFPPVYNYVNYIFILWIILPIVILIALILVILLLRKKGKFNFLTKRVDKVKSQTNKYLEKRENKKRDTKDIY